MDGLVSNGCLGTEHCENARTFIAIELSFEGTFVDIIKGLAEPECQATASLFSSISTP